MTEFLYEDRKTYFSGTKGPSAKNEVFIGGGVFCFWLVINSLWRRLLNSQMPNRSGILTILSNSSRLSLMISLRYRWTRRRDTNDYGSAFLDVIFLSLTLLVKCWNAIDDDLLFSLDSQEFHISVFWVFTLFADPHLEALFMTLPPKNPQTFFLFTTADFLTSLNTTHENWVVDFLWNWHFGIFLGLLFKNKSAQSRAIKRLITLCCFSSLQDF